jgi:hypothetical protein
MTHVASRQLRSERSSANFQVVSRWNRWFAFTRGVWIANGSADGRLNREGRHRADHLFCTARLRQPAQLQSARSRQGCAGAQTAVCVLITVRDSMSGYRCQRGSSRTMLSRRCADDGSGLDLQCPDRGLALARAAGDVLAAPLRVSVDVPGADLPYTWRALSMDPTRPAWPPVRGPAAGRGGSAVP